MVAIKKFSRQKNVKGTTLHDLFQQGLMCRMHFFNIFNTFLCYSKFTHLCQVSEQREGKTERQVMPPLALLIKFVLLLTIFHIIFSVNLLVANWRLSSEFWSPNIFFICHGDQNGRSLGCCSEQGKLNLHVTPGIRRRPHWWEASTLATVPSLLSDKIHKWEPLDSYISCWKPEQCQQDALKRSLHSLKTF